MSNSRGAGGCLSVAVALPSADSEALGVGASRPVIINPDGLSIESGRTRGADGSTGEISVGAAAWPSPAFYANALYATTTAARMLCRYTCITSVKRLRLTIIIAITLQKHLGQCQPETRRNQERLFFFSSRRTSASSQLDQRQR